jgi:histidyl-tRNA synthetase
MKSQLRRADKVAAGLALVLGPAELERGVVQVKDLRRGEQLEASRREVVARAAELANAAGLAGRERA